MTKKKSKKKRVIIFSVIAVVVILGVLGYVRMQQNIAEMEKTTYQIVPVTRGTVEVKVKGAGTVEPLDDHTVYAAASGTVRQLLAEDGDTVSAGDVIVMFESDELESERDSLEQQIDDVDAAILTLRGTTGSDKIYSPVKGVVKAVYAEAGESVDAVMDEHGALAVVCPDDRMKTVISAGGLQLNDEVTVTVDSASVSGIVESIEGDDAVVGLEDNDFALGAGAAVTAADGSELGTGTVEVENPVYITGRGGIVEKIRKEEGDKVSRGSRLLELEGEILSPELYDQIDQRADLEDDLNDVRDDIASLKVYAGVDGVISDLSVNEQQMVQEGEFLFTVKSSDALKADVDIDELDIAGIELYEKAEVTFDALPDKTFEGEIVKINPIGVAENNVTDYTITLSLPQTDGLMIGMSADVEIISQTAENALIIPVEAIQIVGGEKYVALESDINEASGEITATHKVTTGITDGVNIEILSGLAEGDRVAVPQIKESAEEQMMNFRNSAESSNGSE